MTLFQAVVTLLQALNPPPSVPSTTAISIPSISTFPVVISNPAQVNQGTQGKYGVKQIPVL